MNKQNQEIEKPPVTDIVELGVTDAALQELRAKYKGADASKDYKLVKTGAQTCVRLRGKLEKRRQKIKAPHLEAGRAIDAEAARVNAALLEIEEPLKASRKAVDDAKENEKAEKERIEKERVDTIKAQIEELFGMHHFNELVAASADEVKTVIGKIGGYAAGDEFQEFRILADQSQGTILSALASLESSKRIQEEAAEKRRIDDERLDKEREELNAERERVRKEQAAQQAEINAAQAKIQKAEDKRLQEERDNKIREKTIQDARDLAEREAKEKADAEIAAKAEAERQEALRPEKERLMQFAECTVPNILEGAASLANTPEGIATLEEFIDRTEAARLQLISDIDAM